MSGKRKDDVYKRVTTHDFKTHISRYIRDLVEYRRQGYIIERYGRQVALVLSIVRVHRDLESEACGRKIEEGIALRKRIAEEKRHIRGRMLSWPGAERFGVLRGQSEEPRW